MNILLHNHSSYPLLSGLIDDAAIAACIEAQLAGGVDVVTDGGGGAPHPFAGNWPWLDGVEAGPVVGIGAAEYCRPLLSAASALRHPHPPLWRGSGTLPRRRKIVLPGPYTLAVLAAGDSAPASALEARAMDFARPLAALVAEGAAAGIDFIQVDEPASLWPAADFRILRNVWELLWQMRGGAALIMATYGDEAADVYAQLNSVAADWLAVDLASAPRLAGVIAATGSGLPLVLGLPPVEEEGPTSIEGAAASIESMLARYTFEELHLQPARGLGGATPSVAFATLVQLAEVRDGLIQRLGGGLRRKAS